jgi:hypothetical protein
MGKEMGARSTKREVSAAKVRTTATTLMLRINGDI